MAERAAPRKRAARKPADEPEPDAAEVAAEDAQEDDPATEVKTEFVAGRRMLFNGVWYEAGDPVPDAHLAPRPETLIAGRYLRRAT